MFQSPQKTIKWFTVISCPNISQQKYLSQQTYQTSSTFSFITYMYIATARCREVFPAYYRWFYLICPDFKIVSIYLGLAKNIVAFYFQEIIPFIELVGVFETYFKLNSPRFFRWIMNDIYIYIYLYTLHIQHHIFVRWTSSWPCWFPSAAWTSRPVAWRWRARGAIWTWQRSGWRAATARSRERRGAVLSVARRGRDTTVKVGGGGKLFFFEGTFPALIFGSSGMLGVVSHGFQHQNLPSHWGNIW